jgi:hypothetical protein
MQPRDETYIARIWQAAPDPSPAMRTYIDRFRQVCLFEDDAAQDAAQNAYAALSPVERDLLRSISCSLGARSS